MSFISNNPLGSPGYTYPQMTSAPTTTPTDVPDYSYPTGTPLSTPTESASTSYTYPTETIPTSCAPTATYAQVTPMYTSGPTMPMTTNAASSSLSKTSTQVTSSPSVTPSSVTNAPTGTMISTPTGTTVYEQTYTSKYLKSTYKLTDEQLEKFFDLVSGKTDTYKIKSKYSTIDEVRSAIYTEFKNALVISNFIGDVNRSSDTSGALSKINNKTITASNYTKYAEQIQLCSTETEAKKIKKQALDKFIQDFSSGNLAYAQVSTILNALGVTNTVKKTVKGNYVLTFTFDNKKYTVTCNKNAAAKGSDDNAVNTISAKELQNYSQEIINKYFISVSTVDGEAEVYSFKDQNMTINSFKETVSSEIVMKPFYQSKLFNELNEFFKGKDFYSPQDLFPMITGINSILENNSAILSDSDQKQLTFYRGEMIKQALSKLDTEKGSKDEATGFYYYSDGSKNVYVSRSQEALSRGSDTKYVQERLMTLLCDSYKSGSISKDIVDMCWTLKDTCNLPDRVIRLLSQFNNMTSAEFKEFFYSAKSGLVEYELEQYKNGGENIFYNSFSDWMNPADAEQNNFVYDYLREKYPEKDFDDKLIATFTEIANKYTIYKGAEGAEKVASFFDALDAQVELAEDAKGEGADVREYIQGELVSYIKFNQGIKRAPNCNINNKSLSVEDFKNLTNLDYLKTIFPNANIKISDDGIYQIYDSNDYNIGILKITENNSYVYTDHTSPNYSVSYYIDGDEIVSKQNFRFNRTERINNIILGMSSDKELYKNITWDDVYDALNFSITHGDLETDLKSAIGPFSNSLEKTIPAYTNFVEMAPNNEKFNLLKEVISSNICSFLSTYNIHDDDLNLSVENFIKNPSYMYEQLDYALNRAKHSYLSEDIKSDYVPNLYDVFEQNGVGDCYLISTLKQFILKDKDESFWNEFVEYNKDNGNFTVYLGEKSYTYSLNALAQMHERSISSNEIGFNPYIRAIETAFWNVLYGRNDGSSLQGGTLGKVVALITGKPELATAYMYHETDDEDILRVIANNGNPLFEYNEIFGNYQNINYSFDIYPGSDLYNKIKSGDYIINWGTIGCGDDSDSFSDIIVYDGNSSVPLSFAQAFPWLGGKKLYFDESTEEIPIVLSKSHMLGVTDIDENFVYVDDPNYPDKKFKIRIQDFIRATGYIEIANINEIKQALIEAKQKALQHSTNLSDKPFEIAEQGTVILDENSAFSYNNSISANMNTMYESIALSSGRGGYVDENDLPWTDWSDNGVVEITYNMQEVNQLTQEKFGKNYNQLTNEELKEFGKLMGKEEVAGHTVDAWLDRLQRQYGLSVDEAKKEFENLQSLGIDLGKLSDKEMQAVLDANHLGIFERPSYTEPLSINYENMANVFRENNYAKYESQFMNASRDANGSLTGDYSAWDAYLDAEWEFMKQQFETLYTVLRQQEDYDYNYQTSLTDENGNLTWYDIKIKTT